MSAIRFKKGQRVRFSYCVGGYNFIDGFGTITRKDKKGYYLNNVNLLNMGVFKKETKSIWMYASNIFTIEEG